MLKIANLSYSYPSKSEVTNAIHFPDFQLADKENCLLLGNSGSGKTTFLHVIGGLLRAEKGWLELNEVQLNQLSQTELDRYRGQHIGFIFQRNHLVKALTVKDNLLLSPFLSGEKQSEDRVQEVLTDLGLENKMNARVTELSQGQAQRVAIARAVMNKPTLILADEPTSALDDQNCARAIELLLSTAAKNNATLLVATHDQRLKEFFKRKVQM